MSTFSSGSSNICVGGGGVYGYDYYYIGDVPSSSGTWQIDGVSAYPVQSNFVVNPVPALPSSPVVLPAFPVFDEETMRLAREWLAAQATENKEAKPDKEPIEAMDLGHKRRIILAD